MAKQVTADNNLTYHPDDPLCQCILSESCGTLYAFVQCLDTGMEGNDRWPVRYWGLYSHSDARGSIRRIMEHGGKWPDLPAPD